MNYLTAEHLSKNYGEKVLFVDLGLYINEGDKIALIAKNGTGKTSLLRILCGEELPEGQGKVMIHRDIRLAYLPQQPLFDPKATVLEAVFEGDDPKLKAIRQYEWCLENAADETAMNAAIEEVEKLKAWDTESKVKKLLTLFKIGSFSQSVGSLSGGQQKRLALARILITEPRFVILDEPTNHLDIDMIEWLEEYLKMPSVTLLMVTHDRYFMDRICTEILELEDGQLYKYKGNYSLYLEKRAERKSAEMSAIEKAKNLYSKELDWMRRMPKARSTKAKARIDSFYELEEKASQKIEEKQVELEINMPRLGGKILEFHHVSKRFGDLVILDNFSYKFRPGEKVGIAGQNGVGKSTMLDLITGIIQPDSGKVVVGDTIHIGYYDQQQSSLPMDKRAIEVVRDIADFIPLAGGRSITASQLLERFLFTPQQQYTYVSKLSGGEQRRLHLLRVLVSNPNFIILDEPTNDLDIVTLQVLEDFLQDYKGCLIVVSHDRFFLDKTCEHLFIFEGNGKVRDYLGNYHDYRISKSEEKAQLKEVNSALKEVVVIPAKEEPAKEKKKLSFKEKFEWDQLEKEIPGMETEKAELEARMTAPDLDFDELQKITKRYEDLCRDLDNKTFRWLELSEYI